MQVEQVEFEVWGEMDVGRRYEFLERLGTTANKREVRVAGYRLGSTTRLLLAGEPDAVGATVQFTKMGTVQSAQHLGVEIEFSPTRRMLVDEEEALVTLHACRSPLAEPWTSHRDLLGYRRPYAHTEVDPIRIHERAGGTPLPVAKAEFRSLPTCMAVSASVMRVVPGDRAGFVLFSQLARSLGWATRDIADALLLTPRRIRQLLTRPHPLLSAARITTSDPRLAVQP